MTQERDADNAKSLGSEQVKTQAGSNGVSLNQTPSWRRFSDTKLSPSPNKITLATSSQIRKHKGQISCHKLMKDEGSHVADEMDMKRNSRPFLHGCWALGTTGNTGATS